MTQYSTYPSIEAAKDEVDEESAAAAAPPIAK